MNTTATAMDYDQAQRQATKTLQRLTSKVPNVRGALMASPDGRPLTAVLSDHDPRSTAAIVASSRGLGERLADLAGTGALEEIVVRSQSGYVVIYSIEDKGALTVLTKPSVNLALLHLQARDIMSELVDVIGYLGDDD